VVLNVTLKTAWSVGTPVPSIRDGRWPVTVPKDWKNQTFPYLSKASTRHQWAAPLLTVSAVTSHKHAGWVGSAGRMGHGATVDSLTAPKDGWEEQWPVQTPPHAASSAISSHLITESKDMSSLDYLNSSVPMPPPTPAWSSSYHLISRQIHLTYCRWPATGPLLNRGAWDGTRLVKGWVEISTGAGRQAKRPGTLTSSSAAAATHWKYTTKSIG